MQQALGDLNRQFYDEHASSFVAKRERPWPGWKRVLGHVAARNAAELRVLDVGCGNARLGGFLADTWSGALDYVGVDASLPLLEYARDAAREGFGDASARFVSGDLVANPPGDVLAKAGAEDFDLCCAFGILHHIPGAARRHALFAAMAARTRPGGILVASFWRFASHERFRRRFRETAAAQVAPGIDAARLEAGDHLVAWGDDEAVRYCHAASDEEVALHIEAMRAAGLQLVDDFLSEGPEHDLNRYVVFERSAQPAA